MLPTFSKTVRKSSIIKYYRHFLVKTASISRDSTETTNICRDFVKTAETVKNDRSFIETIENHHNYIKTTGNDWIFIKTIENYYIMTRFPVLRFVLALILLLDNFKRILFLIILNDIMLCIPN